MRWLFLREVAMAVKWCIDCVRSLSRRFRVAEQANVAITFTLALIPIMSAVGAAVDYSRANAAKVALQAALDTSLLAGARDGSSNWTRVASNVFSSNLATKNFSAPTPSFNYTSSDSTYTGSVSMGVPTTMLALIKVESLTVTANATATAADADNSCILTLDHGQSASHVSLSLNGAPVVNLSGCTVRSNTSLACNGNDGNLTKSYAAGSATACGRPTSNAPIVPDTYADLAKNITTKCGSSRPGVTWTPGTLPVGGGFIPVSMPGYIEYHVCGDLTLQGTGYLTGTSPTSDVVIVIENGSLIVEDQAAINTVKTAIVMTGSNNWPAKVDFPNGAGKRATLSLSPPTSSTNPWQGVSLYLDPKLTRSVDNSWGPGAEFNADGLVYLGNSNVVTDGNTASANSKCTKFVMNSFVTNGAVKLDFAQQNCTALGLKQWGGILVHLIR
jgi:Flp pilus assembly protein TadG